MGVFLLIQIWSDFFYCVTKTVCGGVGGGEEEGYWLVTLLCLLADNESSHLFPCKWQKSLFFLFSFLRSQISKLWNLQYTSLCKRLCCIHWFFHNNVVWIDFNYYSIHLYQEESNPSIEHPSFLSLCSTTIWNHWMDWNECCCKTMHGGYDIESWF